jgi:hypothetical protein
MKRLKAFRAESAIEPAVIEQTAEELIPELVELAARRGVRTRIESEIWRRRQDPASFDSWMRQQIASEREWSSAS